MSSQSPARPLGELLTHRQKLVLLVCLMLCMFVGALDQTIMATATPSILADLGGFKLLSWLFTSYMLASTVVVPLVGKLSDMYGRKLFLVTGVSLFMVASAACGAAPSMPVLIAFRAIQGIGGGIIFASVFATVGDLFTPIERGKYMGFFTGTFSLASLLGPALGGLLTDNFGWRWVFYINIPFGLVAIPAIIRTLPSQPLAGSRKVDATGAALLSLATVSLLLGLVWAQDTYGWGAPETLALLGGSGLLVIAFLVQESRHPEPIIPLGLFRNRTFVTANLVVCAIGGGLFGAMAYLPTFIQTSLEGSATESGLVTTPQSLGVLVTSIIGGQLVSRTGRYKALTVLGSVLGLAGTVLLTTLGVGSPKWHIAAFMVVIGLGFGLVMPTLSVVIQNAVSYQYLGVATSARQFFMQIGGVVGTAVFGVVLATSYHSAFVSRVPPDARAEIPAATLQKFDDPTLPLDERSYAAVRQEVLDLPGGDALLAGTVSAQRDAVAVAIRHVFWGAAGVAAFALLMTLLIRELPLRRTFAAPSEPAATPGAARAAE